MNVRYQVNSWKLVVVCAALGALVAGGAVPTAAQAETSTTSGVADTALFALSIIDPSDSVPIVDVLDLAESKDLEVKTIAFSGEEGVGQVELIPGEPVDMLAARTTDLFRNSNADVPPVVGAVVSAPRDLVTGELQASGFSVDLQPIADESSFTPSLPADDSVSAPEVAARSTPATGATAAAAASPNDWATYFPGDWRNEARNMVRCTYYANGKCWSTAQRAYLNQSVKWTGTAGTAVPWPFADWGFEYGVTLTNAAMCNSSTAYQGWWLGSNYSEWSTSVPASAGPYVEGNRLFDDCDKMSHEVGIRDPQLLIQGYQYSFTVSAPRNTAQSSTKFSAHYQVLHDDCAPGVALTDCMGLNTNITWPYSTAQSAIVVNSTRNFTVPGCARMYRNWSAPVQWSNGTSKLLASPLGYYDSCLSNDY